MKQEWKYRRGDVYLADLGEPIGSEQGGIRPVAVIQNESGCRRSTTMTVVPLTSNLKKLDQPTHYVLRLLLQSIFISGRICGRTWQSLDTDFLHGWSIIILKTSRRSAIIWKSHEEEDLIMDRYVSINKRSKHEQKEFYYSQRNTWNGLNPVTRTVPNGKGYNRNRIKAEDARNSRRSNDYGSPAVFVCGDICFGL